MEQRLPKRSEVPVEMTWRLEDIYADEAAWEKDLAKTLELADKFAALNGKTTTDAKALLAACDLYEETWLTGYRVVEFAMRRGDQDTADSHGQELVGKAMSMMAKAEEKMAFFTPEILTLTEEQIAKFYEEEPGLKKYEVSIKEILRTKEHVLSKEMEALLASASELSRSPEKGFNMLCDADLKFPIVKNEKGEDVQLTNGRFVPLEMSTNREVRKGAFEALYTRYKEFGNTWAALYDGEVKQRMFHAKARKYNSTFEAAVDDNNVSPVVCDNLIDSVHRGFDKMHRYVRLRKKLLGVDELHMYDVYAPMVADYDAKVTYEEAKELSLKALAPLGEDYLEIVKRAYDERWIDVMENEGKRGGAYSAGCYGVHPYMLLNYNNTLDDVFTLVHEMGHSMHTWYSEKNQTFLNSQYKIFVAEVASTTNEILLLEYMLKNSTDKNEKAYLINHYLESFKSTLYRQTMFEEFERKTNKMAEDGIPLTFEA
ncbi:MAG: oligoendopeptidase F, partial [Lachnospiraceae bacterium]|nr:oligoendopeptidase F [Lachnospiraceae bacterium]